MLNVIYKTTLFLKLILKRVVFLYIIKGGHINMRTKHVSKSNVKLITRTAILLALTILFQTLGRFIPLGPYNQFVVGPLVNACLLVATSAAGIWAGTAVALISPFGAILTGAAIPLPFAPFVAVGNFMLVLFFFIIKNNKIAGIAAGAIAKFGFLLASINFFIWMMKIPAKKAGVMLFAFGWPQLVTAIIGGILALIILKALEKNNNM